MNYKIILTFNFLLLIGFISFAQQEMQVSHNMFNHMAINPGFAGASGKICANLIYRNQWMGFTDEQTKDGNPITTHLSLDAPVFKHFGVGLNLMQDKLGAETNKMLKLNLAGQFKLGNGKLGVGLAGAFLNKFIDFSKFRPGDAISSGGTTSDPLLTTKSKESNMMIDLSFGLFYKVPDNFYFGISSSQLRQASKIVGASKVNYELKRHYYITGGKEIKLQSMPLKLVPSVLIKSDMSSTQFDINCLAIWNEKYWGGLTYRYTDAVAILLGAQPFAQSGKKGLADLTIGLAYDVTTSAMRKASKGSIEIMLGYCFKITKPIRVESYRNVIYL